MLITKDLTWIALGLVSAALVACTEKEQQPTVTIQPIEQPTTEALAPEVVVQPTAPEPITPPTEQSPPKSKPKPNSKPTPARYASLDAMMKELQAKPQTFTIDPRKDNELEAAQGTKLLFPANSLVTADGSSPAGKVKIKVKECYSVAELVSDNLATISNGKPLESGGSIHIEASAGGKKLALKKGSSVQLAFPRNDINGSMQLFTGQRGTDGVMNWNLPPTTTGQSDLQLPPQVPRMTYRQASFKHTRTGSSGRWVFEVSGNAHPVPFRPDEWKVRGEKLSFSKYLIHQARTRGLEPDNKTSRVLSLNITIDAEGKMTDIKGKASGPLSANDRAIISMLEETPPLRIPKRTDKRDIQLELMFNDQYQSRLKDEEAMRKKAIALREQQLDQIGSKQASLSANDQDYFVMNTMSLGWINCDRFPQAKVKTDFVVDAGDHHPDKVILVFDDIRSAMLGQRDDRGKFHFNHLPVGRKVRIVALDFENGSAKIAKRTTKVQPIPVLVDDFQQASLNNIRATLNRN